MTSDAPELLPAMPEEAALRRAIEQRARWKAYRKHTRPFRRAFRGIITRKDAERLFIQRARMTQLAVQRIEEATSGRV